MFASLSAPLLPLHLPQSGDEECLAAWGRICEASRKEFQAIYDRLGVTLTERGESFYNPMLKGEGAKGGRRERQRLIPRFGTPWELGFQRGRVTTWRAASVEGRPLVSVVVLMPIVLSSYALPYFPSPCH
jgi:hypothetical protein